MATPREEAHGATVTAAVARTPSTVSCRALHKGLLRGVGGGTWVLGMAMQPSAALGICGGAKAPTPLNCCFL